MNKYILVFLILYLIINICAVLQFIFDLYDHKSYGYPVETIFLDINDWSPKSTIINILIIILAPIYSCLLFIYNKVFKKVIRKIK